MLKVPTRFPRTWWTHSNITLEVWFHKVLGLSVIPYSLSIRYLMNSWPINYDTWPYVISIGLGYLVNYVDSTKFAIDIALLLLFSIISNHLFTGSIIVKDFRFKFSFYYFLPITQGLIISTQIFYMIFPWLTYLVIYRFIYLLLCTLESVTISYSFPDGIYTFWPLHMLKNHCFHSTHYWIKEIRMLPIQYVTLEYFRNNNLILARYKVKIYINSSTRRTFVVRTLFLLRK